MTYQIKASVLDNNRVRVDCSEPEFLGDAYGRTYATREDAAREAEYLTEERESAGLPDSTEYEVLESR